MTAMRTRVRGSLRNSAAVVAAAAVVALAIWTLARLLDLGLTICVAVGAVLIAGFSRSAPT